MPYWSTYYHLIWATKLRIPLIDEASERLLLRSFQMTANDLRCHLIAVGFMPDHVYVAISIPPALAVSQVVRQLKGASSYAVNKRSSSAKLFWQQGYGVVTFSESRLPVVLAYLKNQETQHASNTILAVLENDAL